MEDGSEEYPEWMERQIKAGCNIVLPNIRDDKNNYIWTIENTTTTLQEE